MSQSGPENFSECGGQGGDSDGLSLEGRRMSGMWVFKDREAETHGGKKWLVGEGREERQHKTG